MTLERGSLPFTVDSALLQELGERLIGKPYIALAELVKNSYDADATKVIIELDPDNGVIAVSDNGHGMDFYEFNNFWMRIGSTHKQRQKVSRHFKRPLTGSKGVGRLAVQFLAQKLELFTISEKESKRKLKAQLEWEKAVQAGDLTDATVEYEVEVSDEDFSQGTRIVLMGLRHEWDNEQLKGLAREIWWLQPPFRSYLTTHEYTEKAFEIEFISPEKDYIEIFNTQINAILRIWYAKLVGKNKNGKVSLSLEFSGEDQYNYYYNIPDCKLLGGNFEIRIFHLIGHQPYGIRVGEARGYLNEFGGVHVYDSGFHLPYYGDKRNDWLEIELTHSHRISKSKLLPEEDQVPGGMTYLPTLSRMLGVVNVDTSQESNLHILITRDRLQETQAFKNLHDIVRRALDFYAMEEMRRKTTKKLEMAEIEKPKFRRVEDILFEYKPKISEEVYEGLHEDLKEVTTEFETGAEIMVKQVGIMGPLATAGISSLAYQHETRRQFHTIEDIILKLREIEDQIENEELRETLGELREDLSLWLERTRMTNALFSYFGDSENIQIKKRFLGKKIIEEVKEQVEFLVRGIPIDSSRLDDNLLLPEASLVEWSSIFQNIFINAYNALLDSEKKLIEVSSRIEGRDLEILVQDTGCGVELEDSKTLFEPFVRKMKISPERRALGYGGTGLGLTIVRLIANNIGCDVSFVEPEEGFSTAFSIKWREVK